MTCTACHSGPLPEPGTRQFKNGMTHGLGEFNVNKSAEALPHLYYPVLARQADGKLAPNRLVWPAFWGRLENGKVKPLLPDQVKKALLKGKLSVPLTADGSWLNVDEHWVEQVLHVLDEDAPADDPSVYIAGGKLHRLDGGKLRTEDQRAGAALFVADRPRRPPRHAGAGRERLPGLPLFGIGDFLRQGGRRFAARFRAQSIVDDEPLREESRYRLPIAAGR